MVGRTIAHYHVTEKIGEGGMGEVYRARDERLDRDVALKFLPETLAREPERLARFEREAKLLASLNHPNIAAIHGLEEANGQRFLVLELVEGETLAERVKRGPLPVEETLEVCRQVAEAVEAAHERGVIHRDLKPANVKVTPEGKVKVLDFGLAKAFAGETAAADLSRSPTISEAATRAGTLLGTAAYMSPEQARGKPVDKRADIWAFGCLLYECLAARMAFSGETVSDTLAKILEREPDWSALPADTPPTIRLLLRRCLQKQTNRRLHHIADARLEIEDALVGTPGPPTPAAASAAPRARWQILLPWATVVVGVALIAITLSMGWLVPRPAQRLIRRLVIPLARGQNLPLGERPALALSPNGTHLVYVARKGNMTQLYLRAMDQTEASPIPGTEGATSPFFSPDGNWIGFFTADKLKKVPLVGGRPVDICVVPPVTRGASWGADDTIIFTMSRRTVLSRVPAAGGTPESISTLDVEKREVSHRWPHLLPSGQAVLFTISTGGSYDEARIAVLRLQTGERKILVEGGTNARYASTGHLIYARRGSLWAVPFDLERLEITGTPSPVLEDVAVDLMEGAAHYSLAGDGSLVYVAGGAHRPQRTLLWVERTGKANAVTQTQRGYEDPHLSADGQRLAVTMSEANDDIWVYDFGRETLTRLTFAPSNEFDPVWTPDGNRVAYSSAKSPLVPQVFWRPGDGSGGEERLIESSYPEFPNSWSPDGLFLAFTQTNPSTGEDIWILPRENEGKPYPFRQSPFHEWGAIFSPDGRWLAYTSNESGRPEVYVEPFPGPGGRIQVSTEGGREPIWARNGRELFYRNGEKMMVVPITLQPPFSADKPRLLFKGSYVPSGRVGRPNYDVAPDSQRFLMIRQSEQEIGETRIHLVLNWFEELKRRVPAEKD